MKSIAIAVAVVAFAFSVCWAGSSRHQLSDLGAAGVDENAKFALHLVTHSTLNCKTLPTTITSVDNLVRTWTVGQGDVDVFFVVYDYDSVLTFEYGLTWPGDWGTGLFTSCAPATPIGSITTPGSGVALFYADCQASIASGGTKPNFLFSSWTWLAPVSSGQINILANPATGDMTLVDCRPLGFRTKHYPDTTYCAGVGTDPYVGPPLNPTEPTTWGAIKAMFE